MIAKTLLSTAFVLIPALASAHGGHPEAGAADGPHAFAHLLWFGLPAVVIGVGVVRGLLRRDEAQNHR